MYDYVCGTHCDNVRDRRARWVCAIRYFWTLFCIQIMELTKEHREILIDRLLITREKLAENRSIRNCEKTQPDLMPVLDMENYMLRVEIDNIKAVLIKNDIDF